MRILALITALLAIAFVVTLIIALVRDQRKLLRVAIVLFIITGFLGGTIVYKGMNIIKADFPGFKPRSGEEIYEQTMTGTQMDCVKIINSLDRTDIFRDCCVWLQVETCPAEVNRITGLKQHSMVKLSNSAVTELLPRTAERPSWWKPDTLGDSILVLNIEFPVPGIEQKMFISADTTKAFYYEKSATVLQKDSTNN